MKVLLINGSPRAEGNTALALREMISVFEQQGVESELVQVGQLAVRIRQIVQETGCGKVNVIAHSKGGLDIRYAAAFCGIEDMIGSIVTINTPHRGCKFGFFLT